MRLHRLTLRAVGPFAGQYSVDFDRLGSSGLFLLEGPTGAGKSSIIDAVVFALYGKVAGHDASDDRMHSDFAEPTVEPFVELDFSTSSGLYRVRRTPKYERPKQRGAGTTTQNASAKLWRLASPDAHVGEPLTTRIDETATAVLDAVGLSRDQFVQTVVLPQGEFASFLQAPAETRRAVLQRLFGTEVYDKVVRRLEEMRRSAHEARREADVRVREAVAAFGGAAGLEPDAVSPLMAVLGGPDDPEAQVAAGRAVIDQLEGESKLAGEVRSEALTIANLRATELQAAREQAERRQRKAELVDRADELATRREAQRARRRRVELAERAERVRAVLDGLRGCERRLHRVQQGVDRATSALPEHLRGSTPAQWAVEQRQRRDEVAQLADRIQDEESLPRRQQQALRARSTADELNERLRRATAAAAALPEEVEQLHLERDTAMQRVAGADAATADFRVAQGRLAAAQRVDELTQSLAAAAARAERAADNARTAQVHENDLRQRHIAGMAGILAASLGADQPCPVCGSLEHPHPARREPGDVDAAEVDAAEQVRRVSVNELEAAASAVAQVRTGLATATAESGGLDTDAASAAAGAAERNAADAAAARVDLDRIETALAALEVRRAALAEASTSLTSESAAAATRAATLQTSLDELEDALRAARGADETVADRAAAMLQVAGRLAEAESAAHELRAVRDERAGWAEKLAQACRQQGFADATAVDEALASDDERLAWAAETAQYDNDVAAVSAALADPSLASVDVQAVVDLAPLVTAELEAAGRARRAEGQAASIDERLRATRGSFDAWLSALADRSTLFVDTAAVIRTANLLAAATTDNARAMTLPTYVLLERFKAVVAAANERLSQVSDGRYVLEHVEERDAGRRSGLGLLVRDTHTEQSRDPRTLSGGETFYCSLALALGLADVVTAEAGGIDLGTLFVDEGFATLDPDTLEQVLGVLSGLRSGGRVVGIVSHVPELNERISERVVVRRNADGSSRLDVVA